MPIRGKGQLLPIPTEAQYREQLSAEREVVACSGSRFEQQSALNIACHNGDIAILVVDAHAAGYLAGVIRYLFQNANHLALLASGTAAQPRRPRPAL
jgi:hypothetical protein